MIGDRFDGFNGLLLFPQSPSSQKDHGFNVNNKSGPTRTQIADKPPNQMRNTGTHQDLERDCVGILVLTSEPPRHRTTFIENDARKNKQNNENRRKGDVQGAGPYLTGLCPTA